MVTLQVEVSDEVAQRIRDLAEANRARPELVAGHFLKEGLPPADDDVPAEEMAEILRVVQERIERGGPTRPASEFFDELEAKLKAMAANGDIRRGDESDAA